jgi:hypothetical protein
MLLGGLDLLIHQAVLQVELMTGCGGARRAVPASRIAARE